MYSGTYLSRCLNVSRIRLKKEERARICNLVPDSFLKRSSVLDLELQCLSAPSLRSLTLPGTICLSSVLVPVEVWGISPKEGLNKGNCRCLASSRLPLNRICSFYRQKVTLGQAMWYMQLQVFSWCFSLVLKYLHMEKDDFQLSLL